MGVFEDIFDFITSGSIGGLPPIVVMILPFVIGLIVGYLVHKVLKIAIIAGIILVVVAYFGFFGLSLSALKDIADKYGRHSTSIRDTSHRYTAFGDWVHSRSNHRLHILVDGTRYLGAYRTNSLRKMQLK